jgi:pentatricopeptide repeat protein
MLREAVALFREMKAAGVAPNVFTYAAMISVYEQLGSADKAMSIFKEMRAANVRPDIFSYNALISAFAKERKIDEVSFLSSFLPST